MLKINRTPLLTKIGIQSLLIIGSYLLVVAQSKSETLFAENFESGEMTTRCSGNCPEITDEVTYHGQYALKIHLDFDNSATKYRTELREKGFANYENTFFYSFNIYLPESYVSDSIWEFVAQWHGVPDFALGENWRNPPLALETTNGTWGLKNRWDSKANTNESGERVYDGGEAWDFGEYQKGIWVNWVFQIKWSHGEDGLIKVWKDGKLVVNKNGPNTFNDKKAPYFKAGIYKGWKNKNKLESSNVTSRTLYFDDIKIETDSNKSNTILPFD